MLCSVGTNLDDKGCLDSMGVRVLVKFVLVSLSGIGLVSPEFLGSQDKISTAFSVVVIIVTFVVVIIGIVILVIALVTVVIY